jgi:hypothetical protein
MMPDSFVPINGRSRGSRGTGGVEGPADLFEDDKLFHKSIALPIALEFSSAAAIRRAGVAGIESYLNRTNVRFQTRTIERIVAISETVLQGTPSVAFRVAVSTERHGGRSLQNVCKVRRTPYRTAREISRWTHHAKAGYGMSHRWQATSPEAPHVHNLRPTTTVL